MQNAVLVNYWVLKNVYIALSAWYREKAGAILYSLRVLLLPNAIQENNKVKQTK